MKDTEYVFIKQYFNNKVPTFDDFKPWHRARAIKIWRNMGYSEKRAEKLAAKHITPDSQKEVFEKRLKAFENWNSSLESTFTSIKDYVSQSNSDDDW